MTDYDISQLRGIGQDLVYRLRTELGESPESIREMPDRALRRAIQKLEHPDRARRRIEHDLGALRDDNGELGEGAVMRAMRQAAQLRRQEPPGVRCGLPTGARRLPSARLGMFPLAGLESPAGWTEIGPDNIGGRTRAIVVDPTDTDRIYAAAAGGGVWLSIDGGASWNPTEDFMGNLAVCSLIMDPTDSNVLYAGTGEGFNNGGAIRGDGIFVTTNGGATWSQLPSTAANPSFRYVNALALSADGATLLAGTTDGIFRSTDSGTTWTHTSNLPIGNLAFHPTDNTAALAGTLKDGPHYTTDGGKMWQAADTPAFADGRAQVCYALADPNIAYASVDNTPSQIWRSTNGGQTYAPRDAESGGEPARFLSDQGWYDNIVWAGDPTNANLVLVGGIDLWRSVDGGDNLVQISTWSNKQSAHADHHAIVSDPDYDGITNRRVFFGNDGGIYRADDVRSVGNNAGPPYTNGWINLNNGYAVTQFYYGAGHIGTNTIIGGTQDNGTIRYTPAAGARWNRVLGGDGGACASDPTDPQIWYGEYVYLDIFRNSDGGATADASESISGTFWNGQWAWKNDPFRIPDAQNSAAEFIAPFVLDPNDANRLIGGGSSLWLTTDPKTPNTMTTGPSWTAIKSPSGSGYKHYITAIEVADGDSDHIVVGHANGRIYRTMDGTATSPLWQRIDNTGIGATRQCLGLTIDPDDHDIIYATFGGYQSGNVWKTTDGGLSWADISVDLPQAPVHAVVLHPQRSAWVYLATQVGVFGSEDAGTTWSATNEGPADVACHDLIWLGCSLIAVTHGRGMFEIDLTIANAFPAPQLAFTGAVDYVAQGQDFTRYDLDITNWDAFPNSLFRPSPDLPPYGLIESASRTWVDIFDGATSQRIHSFCTLNSNDDLRRTWFAGPKGVAPPASIFVVLRDRRCSQTYASNAVAIPAGGAPGPQARRITNVDRAEGSIVRVGGPWGTASLEDVIASIDTKTATYYIEEGGKRARVSAVKGRARRYLRSYGDRDAGNNLDSLPPIDD